MSRAGRLQRVMRVLKHHATEPYFTDSPKRLTALIAEHPPEQGPVILLGGDGTIQAAITHLASQAPSQRPVLLALGGGRTNYIAADLNTRRPIADLLERALTQPETLRRVQRTSIAVDHGQSPTEHAFFIAGAVVDEVIRDCHAYRLAGRSKLRQGHASTAVRLMQLGLLRLAGRRRFHHPELSICASGLGTLEGPMRLLMLSSLKHDHGWPRPYLPRGEGAFAITASTAQATLLGPQLLSLLHGREHPSLQPEAGLLSGRCNHLVIEGLSQLCLDGQTHDYDPQHPVTFSAGAELEFLAP